MIDFADYRAMFLDFGVDPRAVATMSLGDLLSTNAALAKRRGKAPLPSKSQERKALAEFAMIVADDPTVSLGSFVI